MLQTIKFMKYTLLIQLLNEAEQTVVALGKNNREPRTEPK
jgi:hypothetical protein